MATEPLETRIARAIAASGIPWAGPGAACVDPETGIRFRYNEDRPSDVPPSNPWTPASWAYMVAWHRRMMDENTTETVGTPDAPSDSISDRALANGPDLGDAATLGVLLGQIARRLSYENMEDPPRITLARDRKGQQWEFDRDDRFAVSTIRPSLGVCVGAAWLEAHGLPVPGVGDGK